MTGDNPYSGAYLCRNAARLQGFSQRPSQKALLSGPVHDVPSAVQVGIVFEGAPGTDEEPLALALFPVCIPATVAGHAGPALIDQEDLDATLRRLVLYHFGQGVIGHVEDDAIEAFARPHPPDALQLANHDDGPCLLCDGHDLVGDMVQDIPHLVPFLAANLPYLSEQLLLTQSPPQPRIMPPDASHFPTQESAVATATDSSHDTLPEVHSENLLWYHQLLRNVIDEPEFVISLSIPDHEAIPEILYVRERFMRLNREPDTNPFRFSHTDFYPVRSELGILEAIPYHTVRDNKRIVLVFNGILLVIVPLCSFVLRKDARVNAELHPPLEPFILPVEGFPLGLGKADDAAFDAVDNHLFWKPVHPLNNFVCKARVFVQSRGSYAARG